MSTAEAVRFGIDASQTRAVPAVTRVEPVADRAVTLQLGSRARSLARRDDTVANREQTQQGETETDGAAPSDESAEAAASQTQIADEERRQMQELRRRANTLASSSSADPRVAARAAHLAQRARAGVAAQRYGNAERLGSQAAAPKSTPPERSAAATDAATKRIAIIA